MARGTELRIVGAEHDAVRRPLQVTGLAQRLSLDPRAVAALLAQSCRAATPGTPPDRHSKINYY